MAVATTEHHVVNIQKVMLISKTNKSEVKLFWHTILCGKVHERQLLTVFFSGSIIHRTVELFVCR